MRLGRKRLLCRAAACAVPLALVVSGCGTTTTGGNSSVIVKGSTLTIDLGQPRRRRSQRAARATCSPPSSSPSRESGGKAGPYTLHLRTLGARTLSDNARAAIADQSTIAYLGELVPGTSDVSVEIVNQQGLLEVSPLDTSAYLTQPVPPVSDSRPDLLSGARHLPRDVCPCGPELGRWRPRRSSPRCSPSMSRACTWPMTGSATGRRWRSRSDPRPRRPG